MGYLKDEHTVTRWVRDETTMHDNNNPHIVQLGDGFVVTPQGIIEKYRHRMKPTDIRDAIDNSVGDGYLEEVYHDSVKFIRVKPGKGARLLRTFMKLPTGRISEAIVEKYLIFTIAL